MDKELQNIINLIENNRAKGFETTLSKSSSEISKIIEKPFNNKEITEQEAEKLFLIDNSTDLSSLVIAADIARKEDVGDDVTFDNLSEEDPVIICDMDYYQIPAAFRRVLKLSKLNEIVEMTSNKEKKLVDFLPDTQNEIFDKENIQVKRNYKLESKSCENT